MRVAVAQECGLTYDNDVRLSGLVTSQLIPDPKGREEFISGYEQDGYFAPIWRAVNTGQPSAPNDPHDRYYEAGGLLYRYHPIYGAQLCVPEGPALNRVLGAAHDKCDGEGEGLFGSQGIQEGRVSEGPEAGRGG